MFKRIIYEEWQNLLPILSFLITFSFFLVMFVKAVLMKRTQADRLASLPLNDD